MVLVSSAAFGTNPIFGKYAYAAGLTPQQLLAFRFLLSAVAIFAIARLFGEQWRRLRPAAVIVLLLTGGFGYFASAMSFFFALQTLPASLCELVVFIYPTLVALEAWLFLRRPVSRVHGIALAVSLGGAVLLVGSISFQWSWALVLAFIAPLAYSVYLLVGEHAMRAVPPISSSAIVMLGAAVSFNIAAAMNGELRLPAGATQWELLLAMTALTGVVAAPLLLAALPRIGAGTSSMLGLLEPVTTLILAAVLLGERLTPWQVVGGGLVLGSVLLLQLRSALPPTVAVAQSVTPP
jgi:drug/metabolite transporter (DMT)-like permease